MANIHGKIIANVKRLERLMDEQGCSAVVARSVAKSSQGIPPAWPVKMVANEFTFSSVADSSINTTAAPFPS